MLNVKLGRGSLSRCPGACEALGFGDLVEKKVVFFYDLVQKSIFFDDLLQKALVFGDLV